MFWLVTTPVIAQLAQVVGGEFVTCPAGYATRDNRICYKIYTHPLNRNDASNRCKAEGAFLAAIPSAFDNSYIVNEFLNNTAHGMAWLGITCNGTIDSCKNDDDTHFGPYQNFIPGKPFDSNKCVSTLSRGWCPNVDCSQELPFVCQLPTVKLVCPIGYEVWCSSCYRYVDDMDNSMDANAFCASDSAHLVTIHSAKENEFVGKLARLKQAYNYPIMFLGMYVDNRQARTWFDGSEFVFDNIGVDDPEFGNCYSMQLANGPGGPNGTWFRTNCDVVQPYMCKTVMQDIFAIEKEVPPQ